MFGCGRSLGCLKSDVVANKIIINDVLPTPHFGGHFKASTTTTKINFNNWPASQLL